MTEETSVTPQVPTTVPTTVSTTVRTNRNPFLVALWVLGIVFVVGGAAGFVWSLQLMMGGDPDYEPDATFLRIANVMQPVLMKMVVVGVATLIGLQFLKLRLRDPNLRAWEPSPRANRR